MTNASRTFRRGALIAPPYRSLPDGGFTIGGDENYSHLDRFAALYFDMAAVPHNSAFNTGNTPAQNELLERGFLIDRKFSYNVQGVDGKCLLPDGRDFRVAQVEDLLASFPGSQRGRWSLLDCTQELAVIGQGFDRFFIELVERFPIPRPDVPISEILEFNGAHRGELLAFRNGVSELAGELAGCEGVPAIRDLVSDKIDSKLEAIEVAASSRFPTALARNVKVGLNLPGAAMEVLGAVLGAPPGILSTVTNCVSMGFSKSIVSSAKLAPDCEYIVQALGADIVEGSA